MRGGGVGGERKELKECYQSKWHTDKLDFWSSAVYQEYFPLTNVYQVQILDLAS